MNRCQDPFYSSVNWILLDILHEFVTSIGVNERISFKRFYVFDIFLWNWVEKLKTSELILRPKKNALESQHIIFSSRKKYSDKDKKKMKIGKGREIKIHFRKWSLIALISSPMTEKTHTNIICFSYLCSSYIHSLIFIDSKIWFSFAQLIKNSFLSIFILIFIT